MMKKLRKLEMEKILLLAYLIFQLASLVWRGINLNYNSPFNDEAIYVVVGRMGIFQGDWETYNASGWMAGHPYFYPVMAALAYATQGIAGPRLLNVVFGVLLIELVFVAVLLLAQTKKKESLVGGLVAVVLLAASPVLYYVSRLATYDMPGFYFLFLSFIFLLMAKGKDYRTGQKYFLAVLFLFLALLTKIVAALYFPLFLVYSFWRAKKLGRKNYFYWQRYFFLVLGAGLLVYVLAVGPSLVAYYQSQSGIDDYNQGQIIQTFWENTRPYWFFWLVGSLGLFLTKRWRQWFLLSGGAVLVLVFHLVTGRWFTLDKHVLASVFFLSLISGLGISSLFSYLKSQKLKKVVFFGLAFSLLFFVNFAFFEAPKFNRLWLDETPVLSFLETKVKLGDKILVESGASPILATYNHNYPLNITTFDWLEYAALQGKEAYAAAVAHSYFDYIQLSEPEVFRIPETEEIHQVVMENLGDDYYLVFEENDSLVYKRSF
jgi:hypothetical protein